MNTIAGSSEGMVDGECSKALFNCPRGITTDNLGNIIVTECGTHIIRKISY